MHHYFRTQVSFIKTRWVRTLTLPVFTHFLAIASRLYGDIPVGKGEDDGTILSLFLKQSRFPTEYRAAKWEQVRMWLRNTRCVTAVPDTGPDNLIVRGGSSSRSRIGWVLQTLL